MDRLTSLHRSRRTSDLDVPAAVAWQVVASGRLRRQWYVDAAPFAFRGAVDRLLGGAGRRWPPPGRELLETGDTAGCWRVTDADHAARRLVLTASVRAPGTVGLHAWVTPRAGSGCRLMLSIGFAPVGLVGHAYLVAALPAREAVVELAHRRLVADIQDSDIDTGTTQAAGAP